MEPAVYGCEDNKIISNIVMFRLKTLTILGTVTADTQEKATQITKAFNPLLLHHNIFEGKQMPSYGFLFSPAEMERGAIYEFKLYHTVSVEPLELVRFAYDEV